MDAAGPTSRMQIDKRRDRLEPLGTIECSQWPTPSLLLQHRRPPCQCPKLDLPYLATLLPWLVFPYSRSTTSRPAPLLLLAVILPSPLLPTTVAVIPTRVPSLVACLAHPRPARRAQLLLLLLLLRPASSSPSAARPQRRSLRARNRQQLPPSPARCQCQDPPGRYA